MEQQSDEDRLINILQKHKNLKRWVIAQLTSHYISCRETYGNDENGDIKIINSADTLKVKQLIREIHQQFNQNDSITATATVTSTSNPHLEIKTQYLYGKEVDIIINQGTVIGIVSANRISQPSKQKLNQAGIAFAENIPESTFSNY
ncbi:hypothetical protein [Coleofasciculus sp. E1-EBD-02]|jgi:hypothetical protein|uniref:hypothetical protein n=1 Tax=Coleofasciculus sp. E1-EBD-02 TaxID=3068481 RepID=UPI0032F10D9F